MGDSHVGLQARLMSQAMRKLRGATQPAKCTIIFTNQIRMKVGQRFGNPETTSGGRALRFYASIRIRTRRLSQKVTDGDEIIGNIFRVRCKKNKTAQPFRDKDIMITYRDSDLQKGINRNKEIFDIAVDAGVLKKAGSWMKLIRDDEEQARYWEAVQAGLDPEDEDFEEDAKDIEITSDELEKTMCQGESNMLHRMEVDPGLYEEIMNRALDWYRNERA
jgi:recombination protein RecA